MEKVYSECYIYEGGASMSDNLNQIMMSGYPQGSGSSARYVFTCHSCGAQVITSNEYPTGVPGTMGAVLSGSAQSGLSSLMRMIPVIGPVMNSIIGGLIGRGISQRQTQNMQGRMEESKRRAFEEVRGRFSQCSRCGAWACSSCFSGGMCRTCSQTAQYQQQAVDQKSAGTPQYSGDRKTGSGEKQEGPGGDKSDPTQMWEK